MSLGLSPLPETIKCKKVFYVYNFFKEKECFKVFLFFNVFSFSGWPKVLILLPPQQQVKYFQFPVPYVDL